MLCFLFELALACSLTIERNDLTWNDLTMERSDRKPEIHITGGQNAN